jgi:hypothetical protein
MKTVLVLGHDGMGHGDPELGRRILATLLRKSGVIRGLTAVVLFNGGVRLAADGSPVLGELHQLHEAGVDIKPCGTCVDFFHIRDKIQVGVVSNMDEIVAELNAAEKVITL